MVSRLDRRVQRRVGDAKAALERVPEVLDGRGPSARWTPRCEVAILLVSGSPLGEFRVPMTTQSLSRRCFLRRTSTGLVAAAPMFAGIADSPGSARRLSVKERAYYCALVEAVGHSPGTLVDPSRARWAAGVFSRWYRAASPDERDGIGRALAALCALSDNFPEAPIADRLELVRQGLQPDAPRARRSDLGRAVELATVAFSSGDSRDVGSVDLWVDVLLRQAAGPNLQNRLHVCEERAFL